MKPARDYYEDLLRDLRNPEEAAAYLNAALEAGDQKAFLMALRNVLAARLGMTKAARKTKMNRVSLYKMLSPDGNPGFENILRLLRSVGICFRVTPEDWGKDRKKAA
ncbi:MAG: putative addiction module antidote protein [Candidatus Omnitrophica bacterium]|nr:putative addiction module antidote protein [Candidatus Omnitrophota bacterium]